MGVCDTLYITSLTHMHVYNVHNVVLAHFGIVCITCAHIYMHQSASIHIRVIEEYMVHGEPYGEVEKFFFLLRIRIEHHRFGHFT